MARCTRLGEVSAAALRCVEGPSYGGPSGPLYLIHEPWAGWKGPSAAGPWRLQQTPAQRVARRHADSVFPTCQGEHPCSRCGTAIIHIYTVGRKRPLDTRNSKSMSLRRCVDVTPHSGKDQPITGELNGRLHNEGKTQWVFIVVNWRQTNLGTNQVREGK